jgi:putative peptidoglycan lipid II flippase
MLRSAGTIALFVGLSRVLGLIRELALARFLGAGFYSDAYNTAFRVPNLLRDLFAEGALSAAFVPAYTRARQQGGREAAHRLAARVVSVLAVVLAVVVLLGAAGADVLIRYALAPGFAPDKADLTVLLTRIMMPFLALVSFAAVAMGMLNAEGEFGRPASAQSVFNVVAIAGAVLFWLLGFSPYEVAVGWSVATVAGGFVQLLIQLPPLLRRGWRFRFDWAPDDPDVRRLALQMAPATLGMAAVQINLFLSNNFASVEDGAVTWLQYAFRLLYLPIGLFGVALGTVTATGLARQAAAGDMGGLADTLRRALRNLAFLTVPSTVGLVLLAEPIVRLLFDHGRFAERPENTPNTATALAIYSVGLVAYASIKILAPAFYALGKPRLPVIASACAVAANVVTVIALHPRFGFRGIAAGLVVSTFVNVLVLLVALRQQVGSVLGPGFGTFAARTTVAASMMGAAVYFGVRQLAAIVGMHGTVAQAIVALVPVAVGAGLYFVVARVLQIPEAVALFGTIRRRLQRS